MKNILCFGDSNTFGATTTPGNRHSRDVRWTGLLQNLLGPDYYVIEEGLNGRTTVFDDPFDNTRNGLTALPFVLGSHKPLDLIIIMLGTNDLKTFFPGAPTTIARGMEKLVTTIRNFEFNFNQPCKPAILLVSPILVGDVGSCPFDAFDHTARERSKALASAYQTVATLHNCHFFSAATVAECGADQLHMEPEGHQALATALHTEILGILN